MPAATKLEDVNTCDTSRSNGYIANSEFRISKKLLDGHSQCFFKRRESARLAFSTGDTKSALLETRFTSTRSEEFNARSDIIDMLLNMGRNIVTRPTISTTISTK
jgi:hypothetical protein